MLCAYTRPRYQVSVYRTIGPLVYVFYIGNILLAKCQCTISVFLNFPKFLDMQVHVNNKGEDQAFPFPIKNSLAKANFSMQKPLVKLYT